MLKKLKALLDLVLALLGDLGAGDRLSAGGQLGRDAAHDLRLRDAIVGDDQDAVELVRLGDQPLRSLQGEQSERRAAGRVGIAELGDAGDGDVLRPALHEHLGGVADPVTRVVRALLVDDHLVVALWRVAHP